MTSTGVVRNEEEMFGFYKYFGGRASRIYGQSVCREEKKKWVKDDSTIVARESGNKELLMKESLYGIDLERNLVFKIFFNFIFFCW